MSDDGFQANDAVAAASAAAMPPGGGLSYVTEVGPNDVVLGRGAIVAQMEGNVRFRALCATRKTEYLGTGRHHIKREIAKEVLAEVVVRRNGRFLRRVESRAEAESLGVPHRVWVFLDDEATMQKVKQTLREEESVKLDEDVEEDAVVAAVSQAATLGDSHRSGLGSLGPSDHSATNAQVAGAINPLIALSPGTGGAPQGGNSSTPQHQDVGLQVFRQQQLTIAQQQHQIEYLQQQLQQQQQLMLLVFQQQQAQFVSTQGIASIPQPSPQQPLNMQYFDFLNRQSDQQQQQQQQQQPASAVATMQQQPIAQQYTEMLRQQVREQQQQQQLQALAPQAQYSPSQPAGLLQQQALLQASIPVQQNLGASFSFVTMNPQIQTMQSPAVSSIGTQGDQLSSSVGQQQAWWQGNLQQQSSHAASWPQQGPYALELQGGSLVTTASEASGRDTMVPATTGTAAASALSQPSPSSSSRPAARKRNRHSRKAPGENRKPRARTYESKSSSSSSNSASSQSSAPSTRKKKSVGKRKKG